jgi:acyl carrier protein
MDRQFKIHGKLVEPLEVESRILELQDSSIAQCAVIRIDQMIIAFVTLTLDKFNTYFASLSRIGEKCFDSPEFSVSVISSLRTLLPLWMIPNRILILDSFPTNAHSKMDYSALEELYLDYRFGSPVSILRIGEDRKPLGSDLESLILDLWKSVFETENMTVDDNFFLLGGDSVTIIRLISKCSSLYQITIPFHWLYQFPTIRELCAYYTRNYTSNSVRYDFNRSNTNLHAKNDDDKSSLALQSLGNSCDCSGKSVEELLQSANLLWNDEYLPDCTHVIQVDSTARNVLMTGGTGTFRSFHFVEFYN